MLMYLCVYLFDPLTADSRRPIIIIITPEKRGFFIYLFQQMLHNSAAAPVMEHG